MRFACRHNNSGVQKTSPRSRSTKDQPTEDKGTHSVAEENIRVNELLQEQAEQGLTTLHRPIEQVGALVGRPAFVLTVLGVFAAWIGLNLWLKSSGRPVWDEPPFYWLQGVIGLLALLVATSVLVAQARQGQISEQRSQLALQLALSTEQRTAKLIELVEELRRDLPDVHDRQDEAAEVMEQASDPAAIVDALTTLNEGGERSLPPQS